MLKKLKIFIAVAMSHVGMYFMAGACFAMMFVDLFRASGWFFVDIVLMVFLLHEAKIGLRRTLTKCIHLGRMEGMGAAMAAVDEFVEKQEAEKKEQPDALGGN